MTSRRKRALWLALALAAVVGWRLARSDGDRRAVPAAAKAGPRVGHRPLPRFLVGGEGLDLPPEPQPSIVDRTLAATELPPWSRRLEADETALHPARWSEEGLLTSADSGAQGATVRYRLELTPRLLPAGQPLQARLTITGAALGREIVLGVARIVAADGSPVEGPVTWSAVPGGARFEWREGRPAEQPEDRALVVSLSRQGKTTEMTAPFRVAPERPVQFDGRFSEARADGSLILSAGLSVRGTAGWHCDLLGNVYDEQARPMLSVAWSGPVAPAQAEARFELFGLGLHRSGFAGGRLRLEQLRGTCQDAGSDPSAPGSRRWEVPVSPHSFQTAPHRLDEFSDRPWDGPLRDRQIELAAQGP